jgi:hypothetical protein
VSINRRLVMLSRRNNLSRLSHPPLSHGQTASGKTHNGSAGCQGLLARAVTSPITHKQNQGQNQHGDDDIEYQVRSRRWHYSPSNFDLFQAKRNEQVSGGGRTVTVELYLGIYNDELRDLLVGRTTLLNVPPTPSNMAGAPRPRRQGRCCCHWIDE